MKHVDELVEDEETDGGVGGGVPQLTRRQRAAPIRSTEERVLRDRVTWIDSFKERLQSPSAGVATRTEHTFPDFVQFYEIQGEA